MSTKVFLANVSSLSDAALFNLLYAQMQADRKKKIDEKKFAKDKNLSLGVGVLLKIAMRELQDELLCTANSCSEATVDLKKSITSLENPIADFETSTSLENPIADFKTGKVGKKFFNLSHSGKIAMCIISDYECGCDVELKRGGAQGSATKSEVAQNGGAQGSASQGGGILDIADRFFYGEEKELINAQDTEQKKIDMFFRLWTLKESFMKATRLGFELPLNKFSVVPKLTQQVSETSTLDVEKKLNQQVSETSSLDVEKKLTQQVSKSNYKFFEYDIKNLQGLMPLDCTDEYACSICLKDYDGKKPEIKVIDFQKFKF